MNQSTAFRIHGRFPKLIRVHFTKPFVTLQVSIFTELLAQLSQLAISPSVFNFFLFPFAFAHFVKGRQSDVDVPCFHQRFHVAVKESQQKGLDVGTVRVGIGHDDNFVIVAVSQGKISPNTCTNGVNHGVDFLIFENVLHFGLLGVDNLTTQRQYRLELAVTPLFSGATSRISFDQIKFVFVRVFGLSWGQFTRQKPFVFLVLFAISGIFARFSSRFTGFTRFDGLTYQILSQFAIFHQVETELFSHQTVHNRSSQRGA